MDTGRIVECPVGEVACANILEQAVHILSQYTTPDGELRAIVRPFDSYREYDVPATALALTVRIRISA